MKEENVLERVSLGNEFDELICDIFEIFQEIQAINQEQLDIIHDIQDIKNS